MPPTRSTRALVTHILSLLKDMFDYVVVDTPPAFDDQVLAAFDASDVIALIATLDIPALKNLKLTLETLELLDYPRERWNVILNRADSKVGLSISEVEKTLGTPIRAQIPSSRDVPATINRGVPIVLDDPKHPVSLAIRDVAQQALGVFSDAGDSIPADLRSRPSFVPAQEEQVMSLADRLAQARRDRTAEPQAGGGTMAQTATQTRRMADPFADLKRSVHQALLDSLGPKLYDSRLTQTELEQKVRLSLQEVLAQDNTPLTVSDRAKIAQEIADDILGYGPIEPYLRDPEVTEVMVNGPDSIYIERAGQIHRVDGAFNDEQHVRRTIDKIVSRVGRRVDESSPMVDARLPDGSRVNAVVPPLAVDGSLLTHPQVQRRPVPGRRPRRVRHADPAGRRVHRGLRPRAAEHPGLRRYRRRKDHHAQRHLVVHPRRRTHRDDRGRRRAAAAPGPRAAARVASLQHRRTRRGHDPRPGAQLAAHAPRPHRRR